MRQIEIMTNHLTKKVSLRLVMYYFVSVQVSQLELTQYLFGRVSICMTMRLILFPAKLKLIDLEPSNIRIPLAECD